MKFIGRHSVRFITLLRISFWQTRMAMKDLSHLPFKACGTPLADAGITWWEGKNRGLFAGGTSSQCQSRLGDMRSRNKLNVTHHSANTRTTEEIWVPCQFHLSCWNCGWCKNKMQNIKKIKVLDGFWTGTTMQCTECKTMNTFKIHNLIVVYIVMFNTFF